MSFLNNYCFLLKQYCWSLLLLGIGYSLSISNVYSSDPADFIADSQIQFYLELVVNNVSTTHIAAVDYAQGNFYISPEDLTVLGITANHWSQLPENDDHKIAINHINDIQVSYKQETQQLLIDVPPSWLPAQNVNTGSARVRYEAKNSFGTLFNYDIYANKTNHTKGYIAAWNELRIFGDYGSLSSTGTYNYNFASGDNFKQGYTRYDTHWQYNNQDTLLILEAGDFITRTPSWSNPVRLGGLQLSHNFSIRPDIITYPLPQLSGENSLPSTVDLFINGYQIESHQLNPGPFTLTNIPFISGAGEATIVTTDVLGRQVSTSLPLYVSSQLLRQGLTDYSIGAGVIRKNYGLKNFNYGSFAVNGNYRYGATDYFTLESHLEASSDVKLAGIGGIARLGIYGIINSAYSSSYYNSQYGQKMTVGYQYDGNYFNIATQYQRNDHNFRGLSDLAQSNRFKHSSRQFTLGLPLGYAGNLTGSYIQIKTEKQPNTALVNLTWNRAMNDFGSLFVSVSKSNRDDNWAGLVQWVLPFGARNEALSLSTNRDTQKEFGQRINYTQAMPTNGGIGWNLGYQHNQRADDYLQADLAWRDQVIELRGGTYGTSENYNYWGNAIGSLIWMEDNLFVANSVRDSFVIISTNKIPAIPILYENMLMGETNQQGYLLISRIPAYYAAKYAVDPLAIPENIAIEDIAQKISVKAESGYILSFNMTPMTPTYLTLLDQQLNALPMGAEVTLNGQQTTYIGWDGFVYFDHIEKDNSLLVNVAGQILYCHFSSILNANSEIQKIAPLICTEERSE